MGSIEQYDCTVTPVIQTSIVWELLALFHDTETYNDYKESFNRWEDNKKVHAFAICALRESQKIIKKAYEDVMDNFLADNFIDEEIIMIKEYLWVETKRKLVLPKDNWKFIDITKDLYTSIVKIFERIWYEVEHWKLDFDKVIDEQIESEAI